MPQTDPEACVLMLGPAGSGKTSLLSSIRSSALFTHGFVSDIHIDIGDAPAAAGPGGARSPDDDLITPYTLAAAEADASEGNRWRQHSTLDLLNQYTLRFVIRRKGDGRNGADTFSRQVRLIDAGGGLILPIEADYEKTNLHTNEPFQRRRKLFFDRLKEAAGAVLCLDVAADDGYSWQNSFNRLRNELGQMARKQDRLRLAVSITKIEQLFAFDGTVAVYRALDRDEMRLRLSQGLSDSTRDIIDALGQIAQAPDSAVDVRCFPTSTFGFIHGNGCANYDYITDKWLIEAKVLAEAGEKGEEIQKMRYASEQGRPPTGNGAADFRKFWRPFLTADPYIWAAFGQDAGRGGPLTSHYMYTPQELLDPAASGDTPASKPQAADPPPRKSDPPPRKPDPAQESSKPTWKFGIGFKR